MKYNKPPLSFKDQISLLESRNLQVPDHQKAENYLSNISYYRLSAYMLPLKIHGSENFISGTTFDDVLNLYLFDREFRILIFDVIERLEVAFRTQMSYRLSLVGGAYWFEDRKHFIDANRWREQMDSLDAEVQRAKEVFKDHFFNKYDENQRMPIWMTSEVLSLGLLSKLYRNLVSSKEKKQIAVQFGLATPYVLQSWLQAMSYVRNNCAHHSRLWNRVLTIKPNYLSSPKGIWISHRVTNDKSYYMVCCFLYMLRTINPRTRFVTHFKSLLSRYPKIDLSAMGFPDDWAADPFWKV